MEQIRKTGIQVVGISYDSVEVLKTFSEENNISFLLLSDEGSETIGRYGIHNREGYPHPGTYVVDQSGTVRAKLFHEGYRTRHDTGALIEAGEGLRE